MILFPEIDKKRTKKIVCSVLKNYRRLERMAGHYWTWEKNAGSFEFKKITTVQSFFKDNCWQETALNEVEKIVLTVNQLNELERELLYRKFMSREEPTDISIYITMHMSESKFYRELEKALLHFAEAYENGKLLVEK